MLNVNAPVPRVRNAGPNLKFDVKQPIGIYYPSRYFSWRFFSLHTNIGTNPIVKLNNFNIAALHRGPKGATSAETHEA